MAKFAPLILRLVGSSFTAAQKAGSLINEFIGFSDDYKIRQGTSLSTARISSQNCIFASLKDAYPNVKIIGKELLPENLFEMPLDWIANEPNEEILEQKFPDKLMNVAQEDILVWIDPLDGNSAVSKGTMENITILIGIVVGGNPVAGIIHQPFYTEMGIIIPRTIWAIEGVGSGGIKPNPLPEKTGLILVTGSTTLTHSHELTKLLKPNRILRPDGVGYKLLMLVEGRAHAYVFPTSGSKRWDLCAPDAILRTVGGKLTDGYGNSIIYDENSDYSVPRGIVATCHEGYHELCLDALKIATPIQKINFESMFDY